MTSTHSTAASTHASAASMGALGTIDLPESYSTTTTAASSPQLEYPFPEYSPIQYPMDVNDEGDLYYPSPPLTPLEGFPFPAWIEEDVELGILTPEEVFRPQLARRSEPMEKATMRVAAAQTAIVAETQVLFGSTIKGALSYLRSYVTDAFYKHIQRAQEEENPIVTWDKLIPDEKWTPEVPCSTPEIIISVAPDESDNYLDLYDALDLIDLQSQSSDIVDTSDTDSITSTTPTVGTTTAYSDHSYKGKSKVENPAYTDKDEAENFNGTDGRYAFGIPTLDVGLPGWIINRPTQEHYQHFLIPDEQGKLIVAPFIKFDLSPNHPQVLGTLNKDKTIHCRFLRPKPALERAPPYSALQQRLFHLEEPFSHWVDDALDEEGDPTLAAGLANFQWHRKLVKGTERSIQRLITELGMHVNHAKEALTDLENANAFERIKHQVKWLDRSDTLRQPQATTAFDEVAAAPLPHYPSSFAYTRHYLGPTRDPRVPSRPAAPLQRPLQPLKFDPPSSTNRTMKRCHRCRQWGHIRKECFREYDRRFRK
jgi:hypothetical protein